MHLVGGRDRGAKHAERTKCFPTHARLFRKMVGMQGPDTGQALGFPVSCHRALCQEAETSFFVSVRSRFQQLETTVQLAISAGQQQKHIEKFWLTYPYSSAVPRNMWLERDPGASARDRSAT